MNDLSQTDFDVIVLGVGTCGEDLSLRLLGAGLDVLGIEAALVGGECAYWACLPTKRMIRAANLLQEGRRADGLAGHSEIKADWPAFAARLRTEVTGGWDDSNAVARFESRGGTLIHGRGRLNGQRSVTVGDQTFTARRGVVIATGSRQRVPTIPGLDSANYWTSHDVIQAESLPASIIVIGGGVVACELSQVMARFGTAVTMVEASDRLLPAEEAEASAVIEAALSEEGITVHTGSAAAQVATENGTVSITLDNGTALSAERLLIATGRRIDLSDLGLDSVGLDPAASQLEVDVHMRAAEGLWGMGDVTGKGLFTHVALYQSAIVAADILGETHPPAQYDALPRAVFTDPELGAVGLTETEARAAGLDVVCLVKQIPATFRGWLHIHSSGVLKFVIERKSGVLLGATAVGPAAAELLGMLSLAVQTRTTIATLQNMIYAFPTFYGTIGEALSAWGRGLVTVMDATYEGQQLLDGLGETPAG